MIVLILIYGLLIGSFLNVCIYRIPREESIAFPASHCPNCSTKLRWYDNIPLFSYVSLKGKCRYCNEKISTQYPMMEALNAAMYVLLFFHFGFSLEFVLYAAVFSTLIVITIIDLKEMIIPDILVLTLLLLAVIYKTLNYFIWGMSPQILNSLAGMFAAGGLFFAILFFSGGGMGGGDVTLIAALGFIVGIKKIFLVIFLSFIVGSIISIVLLVTKIKGRKDPIPFGPFIVLAFFMTVLWGEALINWYIHHFLIL